MRKGVPIGTPASHGLAVGSFIWFRPSSALTGSVGGKNIHVMIRPGGAAPPPGKYEIHPPVEDPIYGMVALMMPVGSPGALVSGKQEKWQPAMMASPGALVSGKQEKWQPTMMMMPASKVNVPSMDAKQFQSPSEATQVFVISHNPIPGRNAVVVSSGFADLMDALQAGGGATIQVI
jgi:hypothetical protein